MLLFFESRYRPILKMGLPARVFPESKVGQYRFLKYMKILTHHKIMVDDEDFERCKNLNFSVRKDNRVYIFWGGKRVIFARFLTGFPIGKDVDHINHNNLDNRKMNLRICTHGENMRSKIKYKNSLNHYKGIHRVKRKGYFLFQATIRVKGKRFATGICKTEKEAALKYNELAKKYFGEFAYLNKI